ncbi:putative Ig domain-containing protein [Uniformispora flossi]|uniref:putative Ig domain-containing protein n=1 Tax=Uniformispora flossi TaxID=3390723 RepID=UPI003C2C0157
MPHLARRPWTAAVAALCAGAAAAATAGIMALSATPASAAALPKFDHVVIVVHENTNYEDVVGNAQMPYINSLISGGASFTNFHGESHPSQGNYFAMFSGATQGATSDSCPEPGQPYGADNLGKQLLDAGKTFGSYNEDWDGNPATCTTAKYARKHNPWFAFSNVPTSTAHKMSDFPTDYTQLPTVSFVVPNLCNDMHDPGCTATGDTWTKNKLDGYAQWAKTHNSLLIVTWDEDAFRSQNQIATVYYGANVKTGTYGTNYNHYNTMRTLEDMYGLRTSGQASNVSAISEVWNGGTSSPPAVANPGPQASVVGQAVNVPLSVSGGTAPYTCTFTGLPAGLSNPSNGCAVQGTPTAQGTYNVSATAKDSTNQTSAAVSFTWTVSPSGGGGTAPAVTNPGNQSTQTGTAVNLQVQTTGSPAPTCTATGLPAGLSINSGCLVTGTPSTAGTSNVTVTAANSAGTAATSFTWTVTPPASGLRVTNPGNQKSTFNKSVSLTLQVAGGTAPYTCSATGLPTGLWMNPTNCQISGSAWSTGTTNVSVTAKDAAGATASTSFTWTVAWF